MGAYAFDAREGAEYAKRMTRPGQKEKSRERRHTAKAAQEMNTYRLHS